MISELKNKQKKFENFEQEVRVNYKFFHATMKKLFFDGEAPPAMALSVELDEGNSYNFMTNLYLVLGIMFYTFMTSQLFIFSFMAIPTM